jgi:hypothetical protein
MINHIPSKGVGVLTNPLTWQFYKRAKLLISGLAVTLSVQFGSIPIVKII